jgi:hypothetical protein
MTVAWLTACTEEIKRQDNAQPSWGYMAARVSGCKSALATALAVVFNHCANRSTTASATRRPTAPLDRDAANAANAARADAATVGAVAAVADADAVVFAEAVAIAKIGAGETAEKSAPSESVRCRDRLQTDCWARAPAPRPRRAATPH